MNIDIKLHKNDLPEDLDLGNIIAVDGEFMGLNVKRDPLCLIQISTGNSDAHIVQLDREKYDAPNLNKVLSDASITKIFYKQERTTQALMCFNIYMLLEPDGSGAFTTLKSLNNIATAKNSNKRNLDLELLDADDSYEDIDLVLDSKMAVGKDVVYLHKIHEELNKILKREDRINLYTDCLQFLKTRVDLDLALFKDDIWSH